ncbi:MAG: hypothetical protein HY774_19390 [Acidobacteria bacterium]|nr:hypothetical protein [Acidobacteriota bacterium]
MKNLKRSQDLVGDPLLVWFPGTGQTTRSNVGGKAASLISMSEAGLPVPPGVILTTLFFVPWFDEVKKSPTWGKLSKSPSDEWASLCNELKERALILPLTETQRAALDALLRDLGDLNPEDRFAVRSSSPEEDLASASFAGGYETQLGVRRADLERAIRACFTSSLDARVFIYKQQQGFNVWSPSIAVVVQRQIDSEIAGVGFSLNPLTNDYDEAVIDANWGLGTSVVEGQATPDHFVVNKVTRQVVVESHGSKQVSVWLDATGGTLAREKYRSAERTLSTAQLHELTDLLSRVETLYDAPVDIEWAYASEKLHLLQARPITTYVPLPPEMMTQPGERRRLYMDAALSKGITTNKPISPLGLDEVNHLFSAIIESWVGPVTRDLPPAEALHLFAGNRMYMNLSNVMWFASPKMLAQSSAPSDTLMADILANVDATRYRALTRPPWLKFRYLWVIPRVFWNMRGFFWHTLSTLLFPERAYQRYQETTSAFEAELRANLDTNLPLEDFRRTYEVRIAQKFDVLMSALIVGLISPDPFVWGKSDEVQLLMEKTRRGVTGNVVVEMGMTLHRLAHLLDRSEFEDLTRLSKRIEHRALSPEFLNAWDDFLARFGWRGPLEMDLASPRYADDPHLALRQMSFMAVTDGFDPEATHNHQIKEREHATEALLHRSGPLRRAFLRRIFRLNTLFAGTRDTPKHLIILLNYAIRKRALNEGRRLRQEDRLDAAEHIFDLTFDDLRAAARDATLDLRKLREQRMNFRRKLDTHVRSFPPVIDSRGRILRPRPIKPVPGLLTGMPVSTGVVTGPVKVLHNPHEKHVEKGDILVAYTTDPGWTPLFVNAAAIVLEVGGALQHGAVVAREYGKPCVVGIDQVMAKLRDGEMVEVNGTMGTVRLLS